VAWGVSKWPFAQVEAEWAKACICHGVGSGQGLIERCRDERKTAKGEVIPAAEDKRCLLRLDELALCIKQQRGDSSTLTETLLTAWGGEPMQVPNRSDNALTASGYSLSVVADTQPAVFRALLAKGTEAHSGWCNRFLWAAVQSHRDLPSGGKIDVLEPFLPRLQVALTFAKTAGEMKRSAEAEALWASVYTGLKRSGDTVPHTDRARPQVVRLSMLFALADCSTEITVAHLRAALAVWQYCRSSARLIFTGGTEAVAEAEPLTDRVLNLIVGSPGIAKGELLRALREPSEAITLGLLSLHRSGLAYCREVKPEGGGRPAERWYPGKAVGEGEGGEVYTNLPPTPTTGFQIELPTECVDVDATPSTELVPSGVSAEPNWKDCVGGVNFKGVGDEAPDGYLKAVLDDVKVEP